MPCTISFALLRSVWSVVTSLLIFFPVCARAIVMSAAGPSSSNYSQSASSFVLTESVGDLFAAADGGPKPISLAHCVSQCLTMSKGIATTFKSKYGRVDELKRQNALVGQVAVLEDQGRFVYYLVTKPTYRDKPTYKTLESALRHMKQHMLDNDIKLLAIPTLGCGLDKLDWPKVRVLLHEVFGDTDFHIRMYSLM